MKLSRIEPISLDMLDRLAALYKSIFAGHPWHEDLICLPCTEAEKQRSALEGPPPEIRLYTIKTCDRIDVGSVSANDCTGKYANRQDVTLVDSEQPHCPKCGADLSPYYPSYVDHHNLLSDAVDKTGFVGYVGAVGNQLVGFSFGYPVPKLDTPSVAFSKVSVLLESHGLVPASCFYAAETGVSDDFQRLGLGTSLSAKRLLDVWVSGLECVIVRTLNPYVFRYFRKCFNGQEEQELFRDPVKKGSRWFKWDMADFNENATRSLMTRSIEE